MKTNLIAVLAMLSAGCMGAGAVGDTADPAPLADTDSAMGEVTAPTWTPAVWTDNSTCISGAYVGSFVTTSGVGPPARLGTIPAGCCVAARTITATCSCPLHGDKTACDVVVGADCSLTLMGHSEYNQSVLVKW